MQPKNLFRQLITIQLIPILKRLLYLSTPRKVFVRDFPRALGKPAAHRAQCRLLSSTESLRCQSESSGVDVRNRTSLGIISL